GLQRRQPSLAGLAPGTDMLKVAGGLAQATLFFETAPGAVPVIGSVTAKEAVAVGVTSMGGRARVQSSGPSAEVSIDGKAAGETGVVGLDLIDLAPGNHELAIGEDKDRRSMVVAVGSA